MELWNVDLKLHKDLNVNSKCFSGGGFEEGRMRNKRNMQREKNGREGRRATVCPGFETWGLIPDSVTSLTVTVTIWHLELLM